MATSPNFNWPEPDNTDLVKNGALAIRTAVNAIDSSLVDLKGGTTGQVLSKASNSDMDFVWAADAGAPTSYGYAAGKNKIINGDFGIWQRGTSLASGGYLADRMYIGFLSGTQSRQTFTPGTAPVAGYEGSFYLNVTITGNSQNYEHQQKIENARTFAGQTITMSFWARSTVGAQPLNVAVYQNFGTGGSPSALTQATLVSGSSPYTPTSSWQRYSFTFDVPSVSGKTFGTNNDSFLWIRFAQYTTTATNTSLDIWGLQVEAGSTATAFQTATGTIQGELAACQRYYAKSYNQGTNPATATATGSVGMAAVATTANANIIPCRFPVEMRTTPTVTIYSPGTGTSGKIQNISAASDVNATDLGTGSAGFGIYVTGAPGGAVGYWLAGHYQAVAEL